MSSEMKRIDFIILWMSLHTLVIFGCIHPFQSTHASDQELAAEHGRALTVMTYNIRLGYGVQDLHLTPRHLFTGGQNLPAVAEKNLPVVVAAIKSVDPDVIALQEVLNIDQAKRVADALHMQFAYDHYFEGRRLPKGWLGLAILSKREILKVQSHIIQLEGVRGGRRKLLMITINVGGQNVTFATLHRDHRSQNGYTLKEIRRTVDRIKHPVVLLGDFNLRAYEKVWQFLNDRFRDTVLLINSESARQVQSLGTTISGSRIDYILVEPEYFEVSDVGIIPREYWDASDHKGYFARIKFRDGGL